MHAVRLVLSYDEGLDKASTPAAEDFTVTVGGNDRTVIQVVVSGNGVMLSLASPVAPGETVMVSYRPGLDLIQDMVGDAAAALTDEPAIPPLVTISAKEGASSVTGGTAAEFKLSRGPPTAAALTVGVAVTQTGAVIETAGSYQPPEEIIFTAGDATATLTIVTDDDEQQEEEGTVIATLQKGKEYRLGVSSTRSARVTVRNNEVSQPPPPPNPPGPPGGGGGPRTSTPGAVRNLVVVGGDGEAVLTWDAPSRDGGAEITDYEYRIDRRNPWISIGSTNTTHTLTGLVNGTAYVFEVRAVNRIGKSFSSNRAEATPEAPEVFTLDFAHFANGGSITSDLVFVNLSTQPARPAIYFYDTEGAPIAAESVVDVTGDLEITEDGGLTVQTQMEPLGELAISTHGRGDLVSGSVKVLSYGPIGGLLRFALPGIGETVVGASPPVGDALFPVRRQEGGITTGVAIHNLEEEAMEVSCELLRGGAVLEEVAIPLAANGQTSWLIDAAFPAADTSDLVGSVHCDAPGRRRFSAVALEVDPGTRIFTTLPVFPVDRRGGGPEAALDFAHFANGGRHHLRSGVRESIHPAEPSRAHPLSFGHPSHPARPLLL